MSEKSGKTVRTVLFVILLLGGLSARAQEKLMPVMPQLDSTQLELQRQIQYHQLISGTLENSELLEIPQLPKFDFNALIAKRININPSGMLRTAAFSGFMPGMYGFSPFLRNGAIFSAASYQLNDKFTVGGYSFGANSIFSAPLPNQGMNNFDTRGSTLFMQYKVSKSIKIETRVSVSQGPGGFQ
jgi:hypothetical protein